jgi:hypothetical protein
LAKRRRLSPNKSAALCRDTPAPKAAPEVSQ